MAKSTRQARDLTVVATPFYFATMIIEALYFRRRHGQGGARTAGDYAAKDTASSLLMGQLSLLAPLVAPKLLRRVTPGKSRGGRWLLGMTISAFVVSLVADRSIRHHQASSVVKGGADYASNEGSVLRRVSEVAAVATVGFGGVALTSWWASFFSATKLFRRRPLPDLGSGIAALIVALVGWDFIYYWNHRFSHQSRFMWAMHVVHHSSERYNLSTALRQPVTEALTTPIPYGLLSLLGIRPDVIRTARGINLIWQYWIHTETVRSIGRSEAVLNSPSAHRVHHGSNRQYLDRNHGGILIVWDRLFGTFEPERDIVVFGLTKNINSYNPLVIIGHEYANMGRDIATASNWGDRWSYLVRSPGWKPSLRS
jgi:sterol desaturase/sphingolipid hydroxylase (fatty acid hydroxylase superfamily)